MYIDNEENKIEITCSHCKHVDHYAYFMGYDNYTCSICGKLLVSENTGEIDSTPSIEQELDEIFGHTQEVRPVPSLAEEASKKRLRDVMLERWMELPYWFRWGMAGLGIFWIIPAFIAAWGEWRFVAAFAEILFAYAFYWIILIASLGLGIFAGKKTAQKSGHTWLGWVVGIVVVVAVYGLINNWVSHIPGVGWRFRKMMDVEN